MNLSYNIFLFIILEIKAEKEEKKEVENNKVNGENPIINEKVNDNHNSNEKIEEDKKKEEENKKDENINYILDSNRKIDDNMVKDASILIIEEMDCNLLNGQKLKINAQGMEGGRGFKDGVTIFGCDFYQNDNQNNGDKQKLKADFILNIKDKFFYPYIFMIYFDRDSKSYFIRPYLGKNEESNKILYIRLNHEYNLPIEQKELIIAGNIIFQISPIENNKLEIINLSKDNLSSVPKQTFDASSKKEVTIGRNKDCDFSFQGNKSFSRVHTTFEYNEEKNIWIMIDGSKIKSSTNGTWVFCTHSFPIKSSMIFEIMNYRLQITEEFKHE